MSFKTWLEGVSPKWVYHVTYYCNLDSISDSGLDYQEFGGSNFPKPHLQRHSMSGNFFSDDIDGVKYWIITLEHQANDRSDDILEDGLIPIVLRFRLNPNKFILDPEERTSGDYYTNRIIPPQGIQMWNGFNWVPVDTNIDLHYFVDIVDEDGENIVYVKDPYDNSVGIQGRPLGYPLPKN
jgi:hypothetical protein